MFLIISQNNVRTLQVNTEMLTVVVAADKSGRSLCDLAANWLPNVPTTCYCISETYLLIQVYVLPH